MPHQKMISIQQIGFCAGPKIFEEALNAIKFLDWLEKFGQALDILGLVEMYLTTQFLPGPARKESNVFKSMKAKM
jgi:hypothetical protein